MSEYAMYIMRLKSDATSGYIGQVARSNDDIYARFYEHILGSYQVDYTTRIKEEDKKISPKEGNVKLKSLINEYGASSFKYLTNTNSANCYGAGAKNFEEFQKIWAPANPDRSGEKYKLDFAEFILIYKYRDTLGISQRAGAQGNFLYKTDSLASQIKKIKGVDEKIKNKIVTALINVNCQLSWSSKRVNQSDEGFNTKVLSNERDLLYPEPKVLAYAFEQSTISLAASSESIKKVMIEQLAQDNAWAVDVVAEKLKQKYNFKRVIVSRKKKTNLKQRLENKIRWLYASEAKKWNEALKPLGFQIEIKYADIASSAAQKVSDLITNNVKENNKSTSIVTSSAITVKNIQDRKAPKWYGAGNCMRFFKDCSADFKEYYLKRIETEVFNGVPEYETVKNTFAKSKFFAEKGQVFADDFMARYYENKFGPIKFLHKTTKKEDQDFHSFTRSGFNGGLAYVQDPKDRILMERADKTVPIW